MLLVLLVVFVYFGCEINSCAELCIGPEDCVKRWDKDTSPNTALDQDGELSVPPCL